MAAPPTLHTAESLRVRCVEEGECLIWQGYFAGRTPMVYNITRMVSVRRLFTLLTRGAAKGGGYYVPTCGDDRCVDPKHTAWHSRSEHASKMAKNANASISAQQVRRAKVSNTRRSISVQAVMEIRNSDEPVRVLAAKYGISRTMIQRYKTGKSGVSLSLNPFAGLFR